MNINIEEIKNYQIIQMEHDKKYHEEIYILDISRRMNHIVLHLTKYLYPLYSLSLRESENKKALVDSFIMIISASNLLKINLSNQKIYKINDNFIAEYIKLLSELSKACEATDHQEDYPIRAIWNNTIIKFFILLVNEANSRNISIVEEAINRLGSIEQAQQ